MSTQPFIPPFLGRVRLTHTHHVYILFVIPQNNHYIYYCKSVKPNHHNIHPKHHTRQIDMSITHTWKQKQQRTTSGVNAVNFDGSTVDASCGIKCVCSFTITIIIYCPLAQRVAPCLCRFPAFYFPMYLYFIQIISQLTRVRSREENWEILRE